MRRDRSSGGCLQGSLDVGEPLEADVWDGFFVAQPGQLVLREDEIRLDRRAEIGWPIAHVRHPISLDSQLEQPEQLARPAEGARRVRPWILDRYATPLEDRMVRPDGQLDAPLAQQISHVEVEPLAHDLQAIATRLTKPNEGSERLVEFYVGVHELQEIVLLRPEQRELPGHRLPRPDLARAVEFLDLPPFGRAEFLDNGLHTVRPRDGAVEVGQDRAFRRHVRSPRSDRRSYVPSCHESRYARCSFVRRSNRI